MSTQIIPGKVLIIGEYSLLQGGRALFAALKPGYHFQLGDGSEPHPDSPLGRYAKFAGKDFSFTLLAKSMNPGFGSSTAELIAGVVGDVGRIPETKRLWAWYREEFPEASGGDLAVQMEALRTKRPLLEFDHGNVSAFSDTGFSGLRAADSDSSKKNFVNMGIASRIYVFQVNPVSKLKTHEALKAEVPLLPVRNLNGMVAEVKEAFESGKIEKLNAMSAFADELHRLGLETPLAYEVRSAFRKDARVLAVKGCGAGMNDVFLVAVVDSFLESQDLPELLSIAKKVDVLPLGKLIDLLW